MLALANGSRRDVGVGWCHHSHNLRTTSATACRADALFPKLQIRGDRAIMYEDVEKPRTHYSMESTISMSLVYLNVGKTMQLGLRRYVYPYIQKVLYISPNCCLDGLSRVKEALGA